MCEEVLKKRLKGVLNNPELSPEQKQTTNNFDSYLVSLGHPLHTRCTYAYHLLALARVIKKPFETAERKDIERFLLSKADKSKMTQFSARVLVKSFYKKLFNCEVGYPENVAWVKRNRPDVRKNPQDMITDEEYHKLMQACQNPRDKCIFSMLADIGLRVGELLRIDIGHITFREDYIAIWIQTSKTFQGETYAVKCIPYLTAWLEAHPNKKDKTAPLFVNFVNGKRFTAQGLRQNLRFLKKRAGIASHRRIYPHLFRFTCATRDSLKYTEPVLRKKFRWKPNSNMPAYYQNISNEDYRKSVVGSEETLDKCDICGHKNPVGLEFCSNCHRPLKMEKIIEGAEKVKSQKQSKKMILDFFRTLIENSSEPEALLRRMVKANPEMRKQMAELVEDQP